MRARPGAGLALLLTFALLSGAYQLGTALALDGTFRSAHVLRRYDEERLPRLRPFLPVPGPAGYVDAHPEGDRVGMPLYLAQYVLAPTLLVKGPHGPLVVVDGRPGNAPPATPGVRLVLVRDLGDGVLLCRPEAP